MLVQITYKTNKHTAELSATTKLTEHFTLSELANNKGDKKLPQFILDDNVRTFLDMLETFRRWFNKPMTINSCFRQKAYNTSIGGDARSAHLHACAVDWAIKGHTEQQRKNVKSEWESICKEYGVIGSINFYTNGYHLEAFSDKWYGQKAFAVREYRGKKGDW